MTIAAVHLWGRVIGAVALEKGQPAASFQYDAQFARSGIQVAPLMMPLREEPYSFSALSYETFRGLPGLLADSLPDKFGNALIDVWLAQQQRQPGGFDAVERLLYTGSRGMGALEFAPAHGPKSIKSEPINLDALVELASAVLRDRDKMEGSLKDPHRANSLREILRVGTSAGGARAKAVIAWNPRTQEVRSGQIDAGDGFEYWLLKFDGVDNNKDKDLADPQGFGAIEYAYYLMARAAGITMSESRLLEENGRRHFMTRRFERTAAGEKIHMQSLAALMHYDYNIPGANSYEQAIMAMLQLRLPMTQIEEQYRRAIFNVLARNQDDHVKNIAFLMNKAGNWSLSPAFDVAYAYNPDGPWTSQHQMSLNGKRDDFVDEDFFAFAKMAGLKRGRDKVILEEVRDAVNRWHVFADAAGIAERFRKQIASLHRIQ
ncbi:MAG TPA: type II toxin-antitoxin system HipA family toxin [Rhizomicrobium sp.]|jgi:serine/threonine-protein kinase HipA